MTPKETQSYLCSVKNIQSLNRELGLLRRRTIASSRDVQRDDKSSGQIFKYLIVIDFESTCWKERTFRTQEIIEFPAVLLNTVTGDIESEFHYYVQPQEQPVLSSFCTELTGISQEKVNDGIPLNFCLRKFRYWLDKLHSEKGVICTGTRVIKGQQGTSNTTCVTWSDWDLGVCLQYECKRKQLLKPPELTSWIDLRATYRKFYQRKPNGLNGALQDVGINFQGREHSGVDDARNTAKLAFRLIQDGCQLKVTKSLKNHERSSSCNPSIGSYFKPDNSSPKLATRSSTSRPATCSTATRPASFSSALKPETISTKSSETSSSTKIPTPSKQDTRSSKQLTSSLKPGISLKSDNDSSLTNLNRPHKHTPSKIPRPVSKTEPLQNVDISERGQIFNKANSIGKSVPELCESMTPVKQKMSGKRKEITPLKLQEKEMAVRSPLRKAPRKFTPKKISVKEIYVDKCTDTAMKAEVIPKVQGKLGLREHNDNVPANLHAPDVPTKPSRSTDKCSEFGNSLFKKPSPVIGRVVKFNSPKAAKENSKNFTTSTPLGNGGEPKRFFCKDSVSPVLPANQSASHAVGSSNMEKTNSHLIKSTNNSTASSTTFGSSYRTPNSSSSTMNCQPTFLNGSSTSSMKMTPPLCKCGRRSKRKMVQSPGPNFGRFFFSCSVRKGAWSKDGCDYFKWEVAARTPKVNSFAGNNGPSLSRQFTPVLNMKTINNASNFQKRNLGVRPAFKTPMCIR